MKIAVLGAGALGSLFTAFLAKAGKDVFLVGRGPHLASIGEKGLTLSHLERQERVVIKVLDIKEVQKESKVDLLIVFTKTYDIVLALQSVKGLVGPNTILMSLHNGLGNLEKLSQFTDSENIILGMTTFGSNVKAPGQIELTNASFEGTAINYIGSHARDMQRVLTVAHVLNEAGLHTEVSENIEKMIWQKLIIAAGVMGASSLTRLPINNLVGQPEWEEIFKAIVNEMLLVATTKGINLSYSEVTEQAMKSYKNSLNHRTSMLVDVLAKKRTEVDSVYGAVVSEANRLGLKVPTLRTIFNMLSILEHNYGDQVS